MTNYFTDIEIYLRDVTHEALISWLCNYFEVKESVPHLVLTREDKDIECLIVPNATKGGYTSIWFKSSETPWTTDLDCAKEAYKHLKKEVRCNALPNSEHSFEWLQVDQKGETPVSW